MTERIIVEITRPSPTGGRNPELDVLLEQARNHIMSPEEREEQRQSWVRGEKAMGLDRQEAWVRGEMARGLTQHEAEREWRERAADTTPDRCDCGGLYVGGLCCRCEIPFKAAAVVVKNKSLWLRIMRRVAAFLWRRYGL